MKKSELKFKCVVPNKNAGIRIRLALKSIGLIKNAEDDYTHYQFFAYDRGIVATTNAECFCLLQEPLMSHEDAIKLIESVEPDAPDFDIKPFDRVLARDRNHTNWYAKHFSQTIPKDSRFLEIGGCYCNQIIKYEGNEQYHGTQDIPAGWWECENGKPVWRTK